MSIAPAVPVATAVPVAPVDSVKAAADGLRATADDHRLAAQQALERATRNPVLSATESFLAAQVHALLAIEQQLAALVAARRSPTMAPRPT